jgi:hypothetical protein
VLSISGAFVEFAGQLGLGAAGDWQPQVHMGCDTHIATLKAALTRAGLKELIFDPARLAQNNRFGRKLMRGYFQQRGVR